MTGERFYRPGNPRTFGLPVDPAEVEAGLAAFISSPKKRRELATGRVPGMTAALDLMRNDQILSAFPDLLDGIRFLDKVVPKFVQEAGIEANHPLLAEYEEDKSRVVIKLLASHLLSPDNAPVQGGQEMAYVSLNSPPEEQSYEYIGEFLMREMRKQFSHDKDPKVGAFFGWVGRHVMKKVEPSTDFSLDRHEKLVAEEKSEWVGEVANFREAFDTEIEGELTLEKCYDYFKKLRELDLRFPSILSAETPLQWRLQYMLRDFYGFEDITEYLPTDDEDRYQNRNTFSDFLKKWNQPQQPDGFDRRRYYAEIFPESFDDLPQEGEIPEDVLLPKWFSMTRTIIDEGLTSVEGDVRNFVVTYFRFIGDRPIAEGYAYAEKHIQEILNNLPAIMRLTEKEIKQWFMRGSANIFYDGEDIGLNMADEWRDRPEDQIEWSSKHTIHDARATT